MTQSQSPAFLAVSPATLRPGAAAATTRSRRSERAAGVRVMAESRSSPAGRSPDGARRPKLVVFDLDGTLWNPEMYQLWGGGAPFRPSSDGSVTDSSGRRVALLGNSKEALEALADEPDVWSAAVASSTDEPAWARECMAKMTVDKEGKRSMASCISVVEIASGRKNAHFERIKRKTGLGYEEMMFFDNEMRNCEAVEPLGVFCVYTPTGMTKAKWEASLAAYAKGESSNSAGSRNYRR